VKAFLDKLIGKLGDKFEVLWDRNVLFASDEWKTTLYPCFGRSDAAVILLNPGALDSYYVPLEAMVLMWRWVVEPKMVVIPVYFNGVNENCFKDSKSRFYGVGLEEIQAVKHEGDHAITLAAVERALEKVAVSTPMDQIAAVKKVARRLEGLDPGAIEEAAEVFGACAKEWSVPCTLQLALSLLRNGVLPSIEAVRRLDITREKRREITNLLRSTWVNLAASANIYQNRGVNPDKRVLVIRGRYPQTAADYVARAWSHDAGSTPGIFSIPGITSGGNELKEQVLQAFWRAKIQPELGEQSTGWNDDSRTRTLSVIQNLSRAGQPVYVSIECMDGVNPDHVAVLQRELPQITILFLCRQAPDDGARFQETTPTLTEEAEEAGINDYLTAVAM
jgi:hypothetical protein